VSKYCSAATENILATGSYLYYLLLDLTLPTGQVYHWTNGEVPLNNVTLYYNNATHGPFNYATGMNVVKSTISQKAGLDAGSAKLALIPQQDAFGGAPLVAGYSIMQAARYGFLQGATLLISKAFFNPPQFTGGQIDTSPGAMGYLLGTLQDIEVDRFFVDLTMEDYLSLLGIQQMPKPVFGVGCWHQVYDAGCSLLAANFTVNGIIATAGDGAHFTTNLTQANSYFGLGSMTMTSGAANGQSANVASYVNASGAVSLVTPFSVAPSPGDTFKIYPGCDRQQATCTTKFNNLPHFAGVPYPPDPTTVVDGGTDSYVQAQTPGGQAGQIIGSFPTSADTVGSYRT
jgi:hypothetical protein